MKIRGYLHRDKSPYLDVLVGVGRRMKRKVSFLIDTGTPKTIISERDALKLGLNLSRLKKLEEELLSLGGLSETFRLRSVGFYFATDNGGHSERLDDILVNVEKSLPDEIKKQIPSLLGRDVIGRFVLVLDQDRSTVFMTDEHLPKA
jgi:hypothetical protein